MKIFKKLVKAIGVVAFAASIRWSKGQNENNSSFINDNYINKTISNYSSTEMDFYSPNEEKAVNGNRVRLGSGEIIGLSKLNGSITSRTMEEAVLKLRAGDDTLIRSIISKVSESEWDIPSINKLLQKLVEMSLEIGSNNKLMRILVELEKPIIVPSSSSTIFVEGADFKLPGFVSGPKKQGKVNWRKENKLSTPSADSLLDTTKCYGHREGYDMPRSVSEKFETNAVRKLAKKSLKNPRVKREYTFVKSQLEDGIHPVNLSEKSTFVSSTKVLVKKSEGRYIVDVSDTHADILGVSSRTNERCMERFEKLMNELYDLNLQGY